MQVNNIKPIEKKFITKVKRKVDSGQFGGIMNAAAANEAGFEPVMGIDATQAVDGLFALQSVDNFSGQQNVFEYPQKMLSLLIHLQKRLVIEEVDGGTLYKLKNVVDKTKSQVTIDPKLMSIIEQIEQRVMIEIAKIENIR